MFNDYSELENDGEEDYKSDVRDILRSLYLNDKEFWLALWSFICDEEKTYDKAKIEAAYPEWIEEILYHILIDLCDSEREYHPTDAKTLKNWVLKLLKKWTVLRETNDDDHI